MRVLFFAAALCAGGAHAADKQDYLETILVTASRVPQSVADSTSSVSVITREEIERRRVAFVSDLLRTVPGLAVSNTGGIGKHTQIRVRGAEANHVLVLIDGVEANDLSTTDGFDFANLTSDDVERIEIVRGPHSSLWGSEAVAGVINVVTRDADKPVSADLSVEGGSFATNRISAGVGTMTDHFALRVAVNHTDSGGINASREGDEDDAYNKQTINAKGHVRLNDTLKFDASFRNTTTEGQIDSFDFLTSRPFDTPGTSDTIQRYASSGLTLALWDGRWRQQLIGRWTSTRNKSLDPAVFLNSGQKGDKYALSYQSTLSVDTEGWWVDDHVLTFALDYEHEEFDQRGFERNLDVTGYVVEYGSRWFDVLAVSASARYDRNSDFKNATTFRAAGAYDLPRNLGRVTLVYGTGQKDPLFFERFGFSPSSGITFIGNPALRPERSKGWEVNLRRGFEVLDLLFDLSYFDERTEDEINGFFAAGGGAFTAVNLPGTTRRRGIEVSLRARLSDALDANAGYTYIRASDLLDGSRLSKVRIPRHQGFFDASYYVFERRGDINLRLNVVGNQEDFDFSSFPRTRVSLGDHISIGIAVGYRVNQRLRIFARVDNLLDENFEEVLGFAEPGIAGYAGIQLSTGGL
jgi:vitamin B12 transporter